MPVKQDVYQKVTDKIIADLEQGELTWLKPWSAGNMDERVTKPLRHNGLAYSGINVLTLWGAAIEAGYCSPYWMTYRQAQELGAHVRKVEQPQAARWLAPILNYTPGADVVIAVVIAAE